MEAVTAHCCFWCFLSDAKTGNAAKFIFDGGIFANYKKAVTAGAAVFDGEWNIGNFNP